MHRNTLLLPGIPSLALHVTGCNGDAKSSAGAGTETSQGNDEHADGDPHEGDEHALGTVTAGDTSLAVVMAGDVKPGAELHVELDVTKGATPAAVRLWVGKESAVGSMKAKADADGAHFHAHVEVPSDVTKEARLWIEVEAAGGKRTAQSLALPKEGS
jgi:hypothetical protein